LVFQLQTDGAMGRLWAARQLKGRGAEAALRRAARDDGFWAVRRAAVESVEGHGGFFKDCAADPASAVRAAALRRLGRLSDSAFLAERFRLEDSYLAQAEALRALGRTGDRSRIQLIKEATRMKSPRGILERAAEEALGQLQQ
jgi:hypothetical protein